MQIITNSPEETIKLGQKLSRYLKPQDIIALFGNLGSGKTTLVKGIGSGLGVKKKEVNSPSFVLVKEYKGRLPIYHFDLYRIKNIKQIYGLGYEEYFFNQGVSVIEWAERAKKLLPKEYLAIKLFVKGKNKRLLKFIPYGRRYQKLIILLRLNK